MKADKIFYNGTVYTMEKEGETVEGIAVLNGKIVDMGTSEYIRTIPSDESIDLHGHTVLPGFADTHLHLYSACEDHTKANLMPAHSIADIQNILREALDFLADGDWLLGENLHIDYLQENRLPDCRELDEVSPDVPIVIATFCRHTHVMNSRAMALIGMDAHRAEIPSDMLECFPDHTLNGVIREWPYEKYVLPHIPIRHLPENIELMNQYLEYVASQGFTQLHTYQNETADGIRLYSEIRRKYGLKCRITFNLTPEELSAPNIITGFGDDMLKIGAAKFLEDGSLCSGSCLMEEDFCDAPGEHGIMVHSQEELNELVRISYNAGNDVAVHAIGDKANEMVLTAFEKAYDPAIGWGRRFYIIHATVLNKALIERMKKLPLLVCTQPIFLRNFVNVSKSKLGLEREAGLMPLRTLFDNGILVAGGSDAPVREINPFNAIQCAVTRRDLDGDEIIAPHEKISVYEAITMYTKNAAYCVHEESIKGTLQTGKAADFIVLDRDPFFTEENSLHSIQVLQTVLGGETTYRA